MKKLIYLFIIFLPFVSLRAQETSPVNGIRDKRNNIYYAFTNANIVVDSKTVISNGTLLIRDGVIEASGAKVSIPKGAVVYDLQGKFIYPSLIDLYSNYGMPEVKRGPRTDGPRPESSKKGAYNWNEAIKPENSASQMFSVSGKDAEELRKLGFGAVLTHQFDGIARGTSAFVALNDVPETQAVIAERAAAHYSFSKGSSTQDYPSSLMGSIAMLRQTYLDAQWYNSQAQSRKEFNISLEEWNRSQNLPQIFEVTDKLSALRADKIGDEFGIQYIIKGKGDEYQRINELKASGASFIVPLNFPAAYDVEDAFDAAMVSIEDMRHWELAPANSAMLQRQNIPFAFTVADLKDKNEYKKHIRRAINHGLTPQQALQAFTETPARLLKLENRIGALRPGMIANFLITSDSIFSEKNVIFENWVQGKQYKYQDINLPEIKGEYTLIIGRDKTYTFNITGELQQPAGEVIITDTIKLKAAVTRSGELISIVFDPNEEARQGAIRLSGKINYRTGIMDGKGQLQDGTWADWRADKKSGAEKAAVKDTLPYIIPEVGPVTYPLNGYGFRDLPKEQTYLITNATVWTNEQQGVLQNTSVLIKGGKISAIGNNLSSAGAIVIDGTGKHLTPGIIDEHSHIAISRGVNEGSQSITSEVSIGDVINSDDINIYRQLSGGVTAAQLLHGSANAIGGQSGLIKLRWGRMPEQMKIENADGFIKFALGENVKQANWGDRNVTRFPQTRMGVEQIFYDAFHRAREYDNEKRAFGAQKGKQGVFRKDLELEALAEILNKKRFITCHSYVQSEINMLMSVGDSMGFTVNTFTHILEGYKLADKMKAHGAAASTFSDWWAYKYEVIDAIPHNAALLTRMGIVTAVNSDDAEMGRRLNQEAAKSVKYAGLNEEDALKLVTLNPAKMLHLDNHMGSIKAGKDADVVLWSNHPLSIYAKAEKTFVDGILYYDIERDAQLREEIRKERARLINKMMKSKKDGDKTQRAEMRKPKFWHCNTIGEVGAEEHICNDH
jgi:imidazolonepropionase-like amidohydrolase